MKQRVIAALSAVLLLGAANLQPVTKANRFDAPGDQYFGRLHMSTVSIRYHIQRLRARIAKSPSDAHDVLHEARFADEALVQWQNKYPKDAWLPQTAYGLAELYAAIPDPAAHDRAMRLFHDVGTRYARTSYGHLSRLALQRAVLLPVAAGSTPSPLQSTQAATAEAPTPLPSAAPSPSAVPSPSSSPSR